MEGRFFNSTFNKLQFCWNSVSPTDSNKIKMLFVAANVVSHRSVDLSVFGLHEAHRETARTRLRTTAKMDFIEDMNLLQHTMFNPLLKNIDLDEERSVFDTVQDTQEESIVEAFLLKILMLQTFFEERFTIEMTAIKQRENQPDKIHFLVGYFHDQPVAFLTCEFNHNSNSIYIRWITVAPAFQRSGYGQAMLDEVQHRFPQMNLLELSALKINQQARDFYQKNGFKEHATFFSGEPSVRESHSLNVWLYGDHLCLPEGVHVSTQAIGFSKRNKSWA